MPSHTSPGFFTQLNRKDLEVLFALSLRGYRFLTCRHICMRWEYASQECEQRLGELARMGLVRRLFLPAADRSKQEAVYTLARPGALYLAKLMNIEPAGLASATRNPSFYWLEHGLRVSDFMCQLESGLRSAGYRLSSWKSERQLKLARGKALRVVNPFRAGDRIPVVPDGLFSFKIGQREEHFFLEADRGTMSLAAMRQKMAGYVQLHRAKSYRAHFAIPRFRVLLVTSTSFRKDRLRSILRDIGYCPNMFLFATWEDISTDTILGKVWFTCRSKDARSLLDR